MRAAISGAAGFGATSDRRISKGGDTFCQKLCSFITCTTIQSSRESEDP